jgi:hypothetical protein
MTGVGAQVTCPSPSPVQAGWPSVPQATSPRDVATMLLTWASANVASAPVSGVHVVASAERQRATCSDPAAPSR